MSNDKLYCVYEHVFPNGKRYIGVSSDHVKRWRNGRGYDCQPKIAHAIAAYGWDNIEHNIIVDGLSEGQALKLEKAFIQAYNTIADGYNVSVGGQEPTGTYLLPQMLDMIRAAKRYFDDFEHTLAWLAKQDAKHKTAAGYWNEAYTAVTRKHREYSPTDGVDVSDFWYYIGQYTDLYCRMQNGEDVSEWEEILVEEARERYFLG